MKKTTYCLTLLIVTFSLFVGCKKDDGVAGNYAASLRAWKTFKSSVNNSYQYAATSSSWAGFSTETIITVKNGKVVQRAYTLKTIDGKTGAATVSQSWIEDVATLNSHREGAETLTMDEVYTKAKNQWLAGSSTTETYFETKNQGMISTAGYREKTCVDDCFVGIHISFIRKTTIEL